MFCSLQRSPVLREKLWLFLMEKKTHSERHKYHVLYCHVNINKPLQLTPFSPHHTLYYTSQRGPQNLHRVTDTIQQYSKRDIRMTFQTVGNSCSSEKRFLCGRSVQSSSVEDELKDLKGIVSWLGLCFCCFWEEKVACAGPNSLCWVRNVFLSGFCGVDIHCHLVTIHLNDTLCMFTVLFSNMSGVRSVH